MGTALPQPASVNPAADTIPHVIEVPNALPPPPPRPNTPPFPTVIPVEPAGPGVVENLPPRVINVNTNDTGLVPQRPPGPDLPRPDADINRDFHEVVESIQDPEAEITLVVGQNKLITTRRTLSRIVIARPQVADVELLTDQPNSRLLNLFGRSFGTTSLTLWDTDNHSTSMLVRVTIDAKDLEARLKQSSPGADVHVRQVGQLVILEGQVPDNKTMTEVLQLVQGELRLTGQVSQGSLTGALGFGGAAGGAGGGAGGGTGQGVTIASSNVQVPPGTATQGSAQPGLTIINRVRVPGPRQVLLRVKIAELDRTAVRELGVSWLDPRNNMILASSIGGSAGIAGTAGPLTQTSNGFKGIVSPVASAFNASATAANTSTATLFGIFNAAQFSLFLDVLKSNAIAKVLAEPNLMALDGQPAQFIAGGLFPYPVPQSSSIPGGTAVVTVQFAKFGAILTFLPQILANDVIRLDVEPIFSQLNFGQGTTINGGFVPSISQRSAHTVVELREGQTLAIAGLLQIQGNASTVRIPGLGDIPVVGPLFSKNVYSQTETELVVLVTPELVAPMEVHEVPESPGDRVIQPNDWEFYFLGRIEGKSGTDFRATVRELDPLDVMKHFRSEGRWVIGPHGHCDD
jgi:pilus assembly protein CpaC